MIVPTGAVVAKVAIGKPIFAQLVSLLLHCQVGGQLERLQR